VDCLHQLNPEILHLLTFLRQTMQRLWFFRLLPYQIQI
jgi:hypothetical protein